MSLHRSLKTQSGGLASHRNVLTRAERIAKLTQEERFDAAKKALKAAGGADGAKKK